VLTNHTASPAVALAAEEAGVRLIANQSDMSAFAPRAQLAAVVPSWGAYYTQLARDVIAGRWQAEPVWGGLRSGMVSLAALHRDVPASQRQSIDSARESLVAGRVAVFAAPLLDNQGRRRLATGALGDDTIATMDWLVQGVVGALPAQ
jgi:basic membrane protein A and related proteins